MARYILLRTAELYNVSVCYAPKLSEALVGSGLHVNYSDAGIRAQKPKAMQSVMDSLNE